MPGLFDGMRISISGIRAHRTLQEVVAQNISNASNENYTRQDAKLVSGASIYDGQHILGQGVDVSSVTRIRDTLLDKQLREAASTSQEYTIESNWLQKIEGIFNEPSDSGINAALTQFWESWSGLATHPESIEARSTVISRSNNLAHLLNLTDKKLGDFQTEVKQSLQDEVDTINALTKELGETNHNIFQIEAGTNTQANDLRDRRDAILNELSNHAQIQYTENANGTVNVHITGHPVVIEDSVEELQLINDPLNTSEKILKWEYGDPFVGNPGGSLQGVLNLRDTIIPGYQSDLDNIANILITETNKLYSNGHSKGEAHVTLESKLGYESLGVDSSTDALSLVSSGTQSAIHIAFHNSEGKFIRSQSIVVHPTDSLSDIQQKLSDIQGLNASILSSAENDGKLVLSLDTGSGDNTLGESSFAISNIQKKHDTSGFLDFVEFHQTNKSTNTSSTTPTLTSIDLSTLETDKYASVTELRAAALGYAGTFSINAFETATEDSPKTNGNIVQQLQIDVVSSDSIDDIIAKVNALTADFGISMSVNASNEIELSSSLQTDSEGNLVNSGGTHNVRLSFSNSYQHPDVTNDEAPSNFNLRGDELGLFAQMQSNILFSGSSASDIALSSEIISPEDLHAGFNIAPGDNSLALQMSALQSTRLSSNDDYTIAESYQNYISVIGTDILEAAQLAENETVLLESFISERASISGVSLDEELAKMIQYQRSYEANARMLSTFNELATELLQLIR